MREIYKNIIITGFACLMALMLLGCRSQGKSPAEREQQMDLEILRIREYNVEIVQAVEGYCEADGIALSDALERLADKGTILDGRISSADNFTERHADQKGALHEEHYLHFVTEDGSEYYAQFVRSKDQASSVVWEIYKGPIENRESIWLVME